jgi:hypothetical protein
MEWRKLAEMKGIVGVSCTHLGGGSEVEWTIEIDEGSRREATGRLGIVVVITPAQARRHSESLSRWRSESLE